MQAEFFLRTRPVRTLIALLDKNKTWYASLLAKEVNCTYAHLVKILDALSKENLVIFERKGRVKHVELTEAGEELAHDFEAVFRHLPKEK